MDRKTMKAADPRRAYQLGIALFKEGKYEEAEILFEELGREHPDSKHTIYFRAVCLISLGRLDEAHALRDELAAHKSDAAKKLTAKLQQRLRERTLDHQRLAAKLLDLEFEEIPEPRRVKSRHIALIVGGLLLIGAVAVILRIGLEPAYEEYAAQEREAGQPSHPYTAPDEYVEASTFFPKGDAPPFTVAMFLASPEVRPNTPTRGCLIV